MLSIPELQTRITPDRTKSGPHLGCGVQLRQKFQVLIALGVFGKRATLRTVCRRMYETTSFSEPKTDKETGETKNVEVINDATAYARLDNICRDGPNCKSLVPEELDFLRQCFNRLFGDNAMEAITTDFLLTGTMFQLLKSVGSSPIEMNWTDIDPILALEAIAYAADPGLDIEIERIEGRRWTKQEGGIEPTLPEDEVELVPAGAQFRLYLDETIAREKPIIFEFIGTGEGRSEDGRPARAQILHHIVRAFGDEGPWRASKPHNLPLKMGDSAGRFGFCAISGLGTALDELFPEGYDPFCLSDDDLRSITRHVLEQVTMATPPVVGIRRFHLTALNGAKKIRK